MTILGLYISKRKGGLWLLMQLVRVSILVRYCFWQNTVFFCVAGLLTCARLTVGPSMFYVLNLILANNVRWNLKRRLCATCLLAGERLCLRGDSRIVNISVRGKPPICLLLCMIGWTQERTKLLLPNVCQVQGCLFSSPNKNTVDSVATLANIQTWIFPCCENR